jgi:hypothetical protein
MPGPPSPMQCPLHGESGVPRDDAGLLDGWIALRGSGKCVGILFGYIESI